MINSLNALFSFIDSQRGLYSESGKHFVSLLPYDDRIAIWERERKVRPNYIDAYVKLGMAYAKSGNKKEALKVFNEGKSKFPCSTQDEIIFDGFWDMHISEINNWEFHPTVQQMRSMTKRELYEHALNYYNQGCRDGSFSQGDIWLKAFSEYANNKLKEIS